jgi:hypothetical protein
MIHAITVILLALFHDITAFFQGQVSLGSVV